MAEFSVDEDTGGRAPCAALAAGRDRACRQVALVCGRGGRRSSPGEEGPGPRAVASGRPGGRTGRETAGRTGFRRRTDAGAAVCLPDRFRGIP